MFNFVRQYLAYRDAMKGAKYFEAGKQIAGDL